MAISNLLSLQPKPFPSSSFGVKTTTPSGAPTSLGFGGMQSQTPTSAPTMTQSAPTSSYGSPSYASYGGSTPTYQAPTASQPTALSPQPAAQPKGLFPSVVSSLANRGTTPNATAIDYTKQAADYGAGAIPIAAHARDIAEQFGQKYADVGQMGARFQAGQLTTGTTPVATGNAAITAQTTAAQQAALAQGQQAALQGIGYQLTGQQQAQQAANQAAGQAYTGQGLEQQALGTAAGYAQPSPAAYGQTVFNPITGQYEGGQGGLDPQTQAPSLAQRVMSGQMTYDQAVASMGYAGNAGRTFLDNAIAQAGGNPLQLQASGAVQQSNIQQAGTAGTDIARTGLAQATQDYVAMTSAAQFANQQATAVGSILDKTGLNNVSSTDYNKALNNLRGRFSDTDFIALNTSLREAQIAYTNLLSTGGGTPTGNEQNAIATLNINQSAAGIKSSIEQLENAVARRLQALDTARQTYQGNLGGSTFTPGAPSGGGSFDW